MSDPRGGARRRLLLWYDLHARSLPWRGTRDPYAVWVSEVMLQQTRAAAVAPYFRRFVDRFPDVERLASATVDDVMAAWQGLGYYGRARNLHRAARRVMQEDGGRLPESFDDWLRMPGVGRYTAGAIASIAFGQRVPAVDGNARRVLARWLVLEDDPSRGPAARAVERLAAELAQCDRPGDLNQALMELGATVCKPRRPDCPACPLCPSCGARAEGSTEEIPRRRARSAAREARWLALAIVRERDSRWLVGRRPDGALLGGLWEFPVAAATREGPEEQAAAIVASRTGAGPLRVHVHDVVHHAFTHLRVAATPVVAHLGPDARWRAGADPADGVQPYSRVRWVAARDLVGLATSRLMDKLAAAVGASLPPAG